MVTRRVKETIPRLYTLAVRTLFNPSYELPTDEAYRKRGSQCREQPLNLLSPFLSPLYEKIKLQSISQSLPATEPLSTLL
jgi:hypothetical protein